MSKPLTEEQAQYLREACDVYEHGLSEGVIGLPPCTDLSPPAQVVYDHGYQRGQQRLKALEQLRGGVPAGAPIH